LKRKVKKEILHEIFEDDYPIPDEGTIIHEIGYNSALTQAVIPVVQFCPITISIGIQSGQIILDPTSRAYLTRLGYVFPLPSDEVIYH